MERAEFEAMTERDERHWWYRGRRRIVLTVLDQLRLPPGAKVLDAGCGSGRMLDELERYGSVSGVDSSPLAVEAARARGHQHVEPAMLEQLPFPTGGFDLVTCLDVIEHVADDERGLAELWRVTAPGGYLLLTVPAYQSLWSAHDEANQHFRRYRLGTLRPLALAGGWEIKRTSYFNSILLAPAAIVRLARKVYEGSGDGSELGLTPTALDPVLVLPLRLEAMLLRLGLRLPAGLSLLALLRKPATVAVTEHGDGQEAIPRLPIESAVRGLSSGPHEFMLTNTVLQSTARHLGLRACLNR
jgi:trans-aconitate methyltransferase